MAGVGFELKRLFQNRTAAGHLRAYSYSVIITAGPFALMTAMVLCVQLLFSYFHVDLLTSELFVGAVVYSFVFSQILSSGFTMVITRYVADSLSIHRYDDISASFLGLSSILSFLGGILGVLFFWNKPLDFGTKLFSYLFFAQLMVVWVESVYLTALKRYMPLLLTYLSGVLISLFLTYFLLSTSFLLPIHGALLSMDVGMALIMISFLIQIVSHFGLKKGSMHFAFLPYFDRHWRLFLTSIFYTAGLFLPNIIIWQGPWSIVIGDTFRFSPVYDVVTFYAFLSILPLMAMFVVSTETNFYEAYARYFDYIIHKGNFREIDDARKNVIETLWMGLRHMVEFQLVFSLVFLAVGNYLLSWSGITYSQVNMYNVLLMAAFFTGTLQVILILLLYFDYQKDVLQVTGFYFLGNLLTGLGGLYLWGEMSYGFTFFAVSLLSLLYGLHRLSHFADRINYYVFCAQPIFYRPPHGWATRLAKKLYGERLIDLEREAGK